MALPKSTSKVGSRLTSTPPDGHVAPGMYRYVGPIALSIVICTRDRASRLAGMLDALAGIVSDSAWEVLLVDNASTDDTLEVLEEADNLGGRLRVLRVARPGLGAARDAAWRAARGAIIAFTDDDCYVDPTFVDCLLSVYEQRPEIDCVGGRILLFDQDDFPITIDERTEREDVPPFSFVRAGALQGANLSFRRSALEKIEGVDVDLGAGTAFPCEDIDAVAAIAWAGMRATFDPRPIVYHHHGRKLADYARCMAGYDRGRGAYYAKYLLRPDSWRCYLRGWIEDRSSAVHSGSIASLMRELGAAARYMVHRRRFAILLGAIPFAAAWLGMLVGRVGWNKLSRTLHGDA